MMIVVLDTNVIISALLSRKGAPSKIFEYWADERFDVAVSKPLLDELERVLGYKRIQRYFKQSKLMPSRFLKSFRAVAVEVEPDFKLNLISEDPADNRILECAISANGSYIITGDEHLLNIKEYRGIQILSPAEFITLLEIGIDNGT